MMPSLKKRSLIYKSNELFLTMSRAPKQPIAFQEKLKIPKEFIRFATPKEVATYRAEKLKCNVLVELGAGIGGQTIAFSKKCKKVIAVELDKARAGILNQNIKKLRIKNVEVMNGDALNKSIIQKIAKENPDIVFFDTERPEVSERTLMEINPPINKILDAYSPLTSKIAIEIAPYTQNLDSLRKDFNFEAEFLSLNSQLNRLTLYFNELKTCNKRAIAIPSKEKITSSDKLTKINIVNSAKGFRYLYSLDPAIVISNLISDLGEKFNASRLELNKPVLVSNQEFKSYLLNGFKIVTICRNEKEEIVRELRRIGAGKVTLRCNVPPQDYWKIRKYYEEKLSGRKDISLFASENEAILVEKI